MDCCAGDIEVTSATGTWVEDPVIEVAELVVELVMEEVTELEVEEVAELEVKLIVEEAVTLDVEFAMDEVAEVAEVDVELATDEVTELDVDAVPDVVDTGFVDSGDDVAEDEDDWVCTKHVQALESLAGRQLAGT